MRVVAASLGLAALIACGSAPGSPDTDVFRGESMGTTWTAKVVSPGLTPERRVALQALVAERLGRVDGLMSTYRPDSELNRLNRAPVGEPFPVSPETLAVLLEARRISELSRGALDVTVAPLVDAWGFGPGPPPEHAPSDAEIDALLARIGWEKLGIDAEAGTATRREPGLSLDLSSVAKGYAVDLAVEALAAEGFANVMVEVGGEVRTTGLNADGVPWRIGIELPESGVAALQGVLPLGGAALATSGEYRNYRVVDGVRASHTIDPRTGRPIRHRLASVSVVASTCLRADGFATALNVLGPEEGWELALEKDLAALFLVAGEGGGFEERRTPALERWQAGAAAVR